MPKNPSPLPTTTPILQRNQILSTKECLDYVLICTRSTKNVRNVDTVDKHIADARLATVGNQDGEPIKSENVEINSLKEYHQRIRAH